MRSNPLYSNICWYRFGRYQYNKCLECSKKEECDTWYNDKTGLWMYPYTVFSSPWKCPHKFTLKPIPGGIYDEWMKNIY